MAPKKREDLKQEDVLQAVVIADSFNVRFSPITEKKPRVLLPVANIPMLDYTLEFLSSSGVQEIFVFCSHLADQIRTHIRNSKWNESSSSCVVTPVLSEGCRSMGDALREIDAKCLIRSDFVLIYGDTLANIKLQNIVEEHKKRREKDKNSLMTMVFKKAPPGHHTRCKEEEVVMAVENTTNRVVHYRKLGNQKRLEFPVEVLLDHQDVDIRYDLLDCQISICSPQVPQIFTDDFDYQTRDDFVKGILINEEIMGNTIYVNVVKNEYAARISNLQMYDAISKDIINRWVCPLTPDSNINNRENSLSCGRHNVYLSKDVTLARGCILEENVIVGGGSSIGSNTVISQSVIGKNCKIGENVKIMGSYIWNDAVIEDNTVITKAILCDSVHLYKGTTVQPGSVLSWNVKVGPDITLPECVKLTSQPIDDGFGDDLPEADQVTETSPDFGSRGKAYIFKAASDSDDEEELELVQDMWGLNIQSEDDEDDISSIASNETDDLSDGSLPPDDYRMFYSEVLDTLRRAREENISTDNMILEVNSLKHAYNIDIKDLHGMVVKAVIDLPIQDNPNHEGTTLLSSIKKHIEGQLILIRNYIKNGESQLDCLEALEEFCYSSAQVKKLLPKLLHVLYDCDVLDEQIIVKWYNYEPEEDQDEDEHTTIRKQVEPLIKWLQEAEEESSDD